MLATGISCRASVADPPRSWATSGAGHPVTASASMGSADLRHTATNVLLRIRAKVITQLAMDEKAYRNLVDATLAHIDAAFADADPDLGEGSISRGGRTSGCRGGVRGIVSPQPPVRQMWLAFKDRGYHFNWDGERWRDDKGEGLELYALIADLTRATSGVAVDL